MGEASDSNPVRCVLVAISEGDDGCDFELRLGSKDGQLISRLRTYRCEHAWVAEASSDGEVHSEATGASCWDTLADAVLSARWPLICDADTDAEALMKRGLGWHVD